MAKIEDITASKSKPDRDKSKVILPTSWLFQFWEGFVALTCLLSTIIVTFQIAFTRSNSSLTLLLHLFDFVYLAHVIVKLNVGYIKNGNLITDPIKIRQKYFRGTFGIDLLSLLLFPLDFLCYADGIGENFIKVIRIIKVLKVLRIYTLTSYFGKYEDQLGFNTKAIRSFKYMLVAYALMHCLSCGWYMLACPNEADVETFKCYDNGWAIIKQQNMETLSTLQRYVKCLYWATITATSTGYGDIHAVNSQEKWYSVITMLVGIGFFFGPILGYMASTLTNSESKRAKYTHRIEVINGHLKDKLISPATQTKIKGYYEYLWIRHQGFIKSGMFADLPIVFQAEIALAQNKHVLEKAPLFRDIPMECLRMISVVIQSVSFLPKQIIFSKNEIKHTLFYVTKGSIEILSDTDDSKPVKILREGSFFGEVALLLNVPKCSTVRASSYCELLVLERSDLTKILKHFPKVNEHLLSVIERRCEEATAHIDSKKSGNPQALENKSGGKRFTIDKAVITLSDFNEDNEIKGYGVCNSSGSILFHPSDRFLRIWKVLVTLVAVGFCFFQTYVAAYTTSFGRSGYGSSQALIIGFGFSYLVDLMFIADIYIQARIVIIDEGAGVCVDAMKLWKRYANTTSMPLDVLSVFPLEMFCFAGGSVHTRWLLATFLRSNRLLKVYKLFELLKDFISEIHVNIANIQFIKLAFMISFITHCCGCVWFFQACFGDSCDPQSWAANAGVTEKTNTFEVYIMSVYWAAATMTSTGYGDITARTSRGEFIVLFVLIIGLLMYGYCLSSIAATLTNKLSAKVGFTGRIIGVTSFMGEQNLSHALIERVEKYLGLVWRIHRGEAIPGAELLMGDLPTRLQEDVSYEEMHKIIAKVPIFMNTDDTFLRQLSAKLITYVFVPGDTIVYCGDVGREMYIMRRGLVEVLSKDQTIVCTLGPGGHFGEVGLIFGEPRTADVRAKTYCEVAMLRKHDLDEVLISFPLIEKQLQATGANQNVLRKMKEAAKKSGSPRKVNRIDLIEKTRRKRSHSVFKRNSISDSLTEEETNVNEELNREFLEPYAKLHPLPRFFSYVLSRHTINPNSRMFTTWTAFTIAVSCIYMVTLGLQVAFLSDSQFLIILNYIFDFLFLVDVMIKMHVCYYNEDGVLVTHPTATAKNYFKKNFVIDFLGCIPIDAFLFNSNKVVYGLAKLNRLLHFIPVSQYFQYLDTPIQSGSSSSISRSVKFCTYMYLLTHVFACSWYMVACPGGVTHTLTPSISNHTDDDHHHYHHDGGGGGDLHSSTAHVDNCLLDSWAMQNGRDLGKESFLVKYVTTMYWAAATTCSVGYGDIHAHVTEEMVLALVCMIVGVVFYGYIIASAAASLANADVQRSRYQQKLDTINRFLKEQKIQPDLEKRVKGFYEFLWNRNKGVDLENLFQGLPISLQADITLSLYKDIIESVPLFQGTELGFTKMLSLYIQPLLVPKGEYIVRKGDIGEEMFFLNKGVVEVVSEHDNPIIFDTMAPGRFFGEISTIFKCPRTASIRTQTNVEMFVLKKKDLDVVLSHYPQIKKKIIETAEERQRMVAERAAAFAKKKKEEEEENKRKAEEAKQNGGESGGSGGNEQDKNNDSQIKALEDAEVVIIPSANARFVNWLKETRDLVIEKSKFVIDTHSRWHWLINANCFLIAFTYITITYMSTFQHHPTSLVVLNIIAEIIFYVEIYLKFHLSFLTKTGDEERDPKKIFQNYLKGKFRFDAVANFPLQIFCFAAPSDLRMRYYSYFNLIHLLRIQKLRSWFSNYLKKLNINVLLIRLTENLIQIILTLQTFACIWYFIACPGNTCRDDTWVVKRHDVDETAVFTPEENYGDSVYWALATMTSAGYGDIHATNTLEKVFATVVMVFGKLLFGFVLGNVASTMANMEVLREIFEERFRGMQSHMREQSMPTDIQHRVVNFFQYIWRRNRGSTNDGIFDDLPPCLNAELCLELTGDFVKRVPLLQDCELPFIRLLSTKTQLVQFHRDEFITRKGDIGDEMYFIKSGTVDVLDDGVIVNTLKEGNFFGDESVFGNSPRRQCTRAVTHVDLFCLRSNDLKLAFQSFPEEEERVLKTNSS